MTTTDRPKQRFDFVDEIIMVRTMKGRINSWNRSAAELYGWGTEDAIGRISHELLQTRFPKPLEEIESELVRKGRWEGKLVQTTRDGGRVVVASRWALDSEGKSEVVVETNAPSEVVIETNPPSDDRGNDGKSTNKIEDTLAKLANIVLGGGALLLTLVSVYFIYYYEWTAQRQFTNSISKLIHLFLPIGLASGLFASLRLKPSYKINLALFVVSLAVTLLSMELFLKLSDPTSAGPRKPAMLNLMEYSTDKEKDAAELTKKFGVEIDTRTADEVIASLQKAGVAAVPILVPGSSFVEGPNNSIKSVLKIRAQEVIPLGGIADRVTVLCNENGQWVTYKSDKHGFNNRREAWQSGPIEVGILGDSYAHGMCVPPDRNFAALIRQRYPATLNLGIPGAGPVLELATLKEYLQPLKPKVVLWFYYEGNDLLDLQKERKNNLLMRYLKDDLTQNLVALQSEIDQAYLEDIPRQRALASSRRAERQGKGVNLIDRFIDFVVLGNLRNRLSLVNSTTADEVKNLADLAGPNLGVFRDILTQVKTSVGTWGGKIYFVYLPDWPRYSDNELEPVAKQRDSVLALVTSLGIPVIDIHPTFQAQSDPLSLFPFREPGHYTEKGHLLVAEEVMRVISSTLTPNS